MQTRTPTKLRAASPKGAPDLEKERRVNGSRNHPGDRCAGGARYAMKPHGQARHFNPPPSPWESHSPEHCSGDAFFLARGCLNHLKNPCKRKAWGSGLSNDFCFLPI